MKTFEKWLDKDNYRFAYIVKNNDSSVDYIIKQYGVENSEWCRVSFNTFKNRGGKVYDNNGHCTECKNIKEIKELVEFLVEGIC